MTDEEFIHLWEDGLPVRAISARAGRNPQWASGRASALRGRGVSLTFRDPGFSRYSNGVAGACREKPVIATISGCMVSSVGPDAHETIQAMREYCGFKA